MKMIVDDNIPFAREVFGSLGEVHLVPGRAIDATLVRDAEILVLRSITQVDENLLRGSRVQFVGTATTGTDHIDQDYLKANNILFASAAGANADSVVEYVLTALVLNTQKSGQSLAGRSLGIVGVGNIGSGLAIKAKALGLDVVLNDPPKKRLSASVDYRSLSEICDCDFISLHVPLTHEGSDATFHLFDQDRLASLKPETVLINSARGAVVDNVALLKVLKQGGLGAAVLDVWENEPNIRWELLSQLEIASPHIAGYAIDGKIKATLMVYEMLCAMLGTSPSLQIQSLSLPQAEQIQLDATGRSDIDVLSDLCLQAYDLRADHEKLLALLHLDLAERPVAFDRLRKTYPERRTFHSAAVSLKNGSPHLGKQISGLGFRLE